MEPEEYQELRAEIHTLKKKLKSMAGEAVSEGDEKASEYAQMLREKGRIMAEKTRMAARKVDNYAHEHPWLWMGLGVMVGAAVVGGICKKKCGCGR
jgi:ElaB/YqjD/DUF883 family membrane-anchored ribosome-binding protein